MSALRTLIVFASALLALVPVARAGLNAEQEFLQLKRWIVGNYAKLVSATYGDSLAGAEDLRTALATLASDPSEATLVDARQAWVRARAPYLQSEAFRFYDGPIDGEGGPEGHLNAWPVDEAYIDHILAGDAAITPGLLAELNEKDGETNISTGYHAIEYLLWGRDTFADSPGRRRAADLNPRHHAYLAAAADLLVQQLGSLAAEWAPEKAGNYRAAFVSADPDDSLQKILTGLSVLTGFELAGERLLVAYDTQQQEDEHSCFSDTTHLDALYDLTGIVNVYTGRYGAVVGPSLKNLAETIAPGLESQIDAALEEAQTAVDAIPTPFDQAILGDDSAAGRMAVLTAVSDLEDLAKLFEKLLTALDFELPDTGDIEG